MNILQVNHLDNVGGAARIAWALHKSYRELGNNAWLVVGAKYSNDYFVRAIEVKPPQIALPVYNLGEWISGKNIKLFRKDLGKYLKRISEQPHFIRKWNDFWGMDDFNYPGTWDLLRLSDHRPDVVHLHNLHSNYFDLRYLSHLSHLVPTVLTLHDAWLLSGHCAHSFDCDRWKYGCGRCPFLDTPPAVKRDATAYNWRRKKRLYQKSCLYVIAPSQWLINKVMESILAPATIQYKVIPNGVDLSIFKPFDKNHARSTLDIPRDIFVLIFVATGSKGNAFKDYGTIQKAIERLGGIWNGQRLLFIAIGGDNKRKEVFKMGNIEINYMPYISSVETLAKYYQSADIYVHASRADTYPCVILEALACGTPVVATGVGGITEQISDGVTGFVTLPADSDAMVDRILRLLRDEDLRKRFSLSAAEDANNRFGIERMTQEYLIYYHEIIKDWSSRYGKSVAL